MKRILAALLSLVLLTALASCGETRDGSENETVPTPDRESYTELCQEELDSTLMQGAVYVTVNGEEMLSLANGKADKTTGADNSAEAVYQFASITKQFTAAAILRLYEEGKLDLQDTLDKFFPDYAHAGEMTVHLLLCMRSGLPDYVNDSEEDGRCYTDLDIPFEVSSENTSDENLRAIEDWIFSQELRFDPDSRFEYSNSGYLLLAQIIEQVSGTSYKEYLTKEFFEPLGMTSAGFCDDYDKEGFTVAKEYMRAGGFEWTEYPGVRFGCGDLMCSPEDLAKWGDALMSGKVLSDSSWKLMTTDCSPDESSVRYGYGLMINETEDGTDVYFHSGRFTSYCSMMLMIPEGGYTGITVSNRSDEAAVNLCIKLAEIYHDTMYVPE